MIVSLLLITVVTLLLYVASHRLTGFQIAAVFLFGAAGAGLIIFPNMASYAALYLGVGRGTDLLLYFSILAGMFVVANAYFRFKRQERQIIALTRQLALDRAQIPRFSVNGERT